MARNKNTARGTQLRQQAPNETSRHMEAFEAYAAARDAALTNPISRIARQLTVARTTVQVWRRVFGWEERYEQRKDAVRAAIDEKSAKPLVAVKLEWAGKLNDLLGEWWELHCGTEEKRKAYVATLSLEQAEQLLVQFLRLRGEPDVVHHAEAVIVHKHNWVANLSEADAGTLLGFARERAERTLAN